MPVSWFLVFCAVPVVCQLQCVDKPLVPLHMTSGIPEVQGLAWLSYPITEEDLENRYIEKWPFHARRPPSWHHKLGSFESAEQLLKTQQIAHTVPLLMHPSKKFSQANCEWVKQGMKDLRGEYADVYEAYLDGVTVVCHLVAAYWTPLASLMRDLEQSTGFPFMANMYLSPRGAQGFTAHSDNKDGYIVQVAGKKRWVVYEGDFPLPLRQHRVGRQWEKSPKRPSSRLVFNATLEAGDVFLVPRGFVHFAESLSDAASMHFTVSAVQNLEWGPFLEEIVQNFPKASIPDEAKDFFLNALLDAINTESDDPKNVYLRRSLPFLYQAPTSRALLLEQLDKVIAEFRYTLRSQLSDVSADMLASVEASFKVLLASPKRMDVLNDVLKSNAVKLDYVHRLISAGLSREPATTIGSSLQCGMWCSGVKPTLEILPSVLQLNWQTESIESSLNLRKTATVEEMLRLLIMESSFCVDDFVGNDHFEKLSLFKVLVRKELICSS